MMNIRIVDNTMRFDTEEHTLEELGIEVGSVHWAMISAGGTGYIYAPETNELVNKGDAISINPEEYVIEE